MVNHIIKQSGYEGQTPAGVIITGGGALTINCTESCRRVMQLPAKIGIPSGLHGLTDEINSPVYASAVGLALFGYRNKEQSSSQPKIKLSGMIKSIPGKQFAGKVIEFIKSFLP